MHIVLLNSCFISERKDRIQTTTPHLRIGIASLASFLRENNTVVTIIDPQAEKLSLPELTEKICSHKPDYLGCPAYTEEIHDAARIAQSVKNKHPGIFTVIGGPHVTALPVDTLKEFRSFDIGIVGEGELTFLDLIESQKFDNINGIVYRKKNAIIVNPPGGTIAQLDMLPFPAWDLYELKKYDKKIPLEPLRSCPYSCSFCFKALGTEIRYKSPQRIVEEIEYHLRKHDCVNFRLLAGTFPLNKKHALNVCEEIIRKKLKINWNSSTRTDTLDEELLRMMRRSGCELIHLGIESADPTILKQCNKGTNIETAEYIIKLCKKIGIKTRLNFILGLPFETRDTVRSTQRFALKMRKYVDNVNFAILTPFPGTKVYDMAVNNEGGLRIKTKNWQLYGKQGGLSLLHENFQEDELQHYQSNFYLSFYLRSPLKAIKLMKVTSLEGIFQIIKKIIPGEKNEKKI